MMDDIDSYIDQNFDQTVEWLMSLCRLPSVSAQNVAIEETAHHLATELGELGFSTDVAPKPEGGHPVLLAERDERASRTLLFYNHYDVQPPEPLDLWTTPPFEPAIRDGKLYARGASDNKGNIAARLAALRAILTVRGSLPVNVRFLIEGDEEIGSPNLAPFVERHAQRLRADACLWEGSGVNWQGAPEVTLGVKGLLYVELEVRVATRDSHSSWATVVPNAAWRLAWALASLKDEDERIRIDGFYDDVRPPTREEDAAVAKLPDESAETIRSLGLRQALLGVGGVEFKRRHLFEPTCTIDGLSAGYEGPGAKTVLPAEARAKIEFRLVPDQDPDDIFRKLRRHLDRHGFDDIEARVLSAEAAARTPITAPFVQDVAETARRTYGVEPMLVPTMAGTGPLHAFIRHLGVQSADCGVGYPDSRIHAPDENVRLEDVRRNIHHIAALLLRFGGVE
ncbi:MAG TPA: M20/M25/M40 family metallo-hydrolase [Dehalococcoidia bacterium]|nr:M20/M25/M40 family metallo-hydrolase [Dehalococcoidia bacterium]